MRKSRWPILLGGVAAIFLFPAPSVAQDESPCSDPLHSAFDFWMGEWEVRLADGSLAGHSTVRKRANGCNLAEDWQGAGVAGAAQAQEPRLSGTFTIDVDRGRLEGDACLAGLPNDVKTFVLNRGVNIREIRATRGGEAIDYDGVYDAVGVGDGTRYTLAKPVTTGGFCVSYLGAFPVFAVDRGEFSVGDWKGRVAFDGRTLRVAEQARFYPAVEGPNGSQIIDVAYDITVICPGCASIYVNGSSPQRGPQARFTSEIARPLLLYAGDFPFSQTAGLNFVGTEVSATDAAVIGEGIRSLIDAHAAYVGVPYEATPTLLSFAAVSRERQLGRASWGFTTWPTIAFDGRTRFSFLVATDSTGNRRLDDSRRRFLAHELAHHYFGSRYRPQGPLRWFMTESTAEFLALLSLGAWAPTPSTVTV